MEFTQKELQQYKELENLGFITPLTDYTHTNDSSRLYYYNGKQVTYNQFKRLKSNEEAETKW